MVEEARWACGLRMSAHGLVLTHSPGFIKQSEYIGKRFYFSRCSSSGKHELNSNVKYLAPIPRPNIFFAIPYFSLSRNRILRLILQNLFYSVNSSHLFPFLFYYFLEIETSWEYSFPFLSVNSSHLFPFCFYYLLEIETSWKYSFPFFSVNSSHLFPFLFCYFLEIETSWEYSCLPHYLL